MQLFGYVLCRSSLHEATTGAARNHHEEIRKKKIAERDGKIRDLLNMLTRKLVTAYAVKERLQKPSTYVYDLETWCDGCSA